MVNFHSPETFIRRVRLRCPPGDALAMQLRAGATLRGASFRVRALPIQAILCVRRLCDPKPGSLRLDRAGAALPPEWESAVEQSLEQIARRAVRAAFEPAPEDAPAVWFADRAEFLAALALAVLDHSLWRSWWWGALLAPGDRLLSLKAQWRESGRDVSAALDLLHSMRKAVPFLRNLSEDESSVTLAAMLHAHGIELPLPLDQWRMPGLSPRTAQELRVPSLPPIATHEAEILTLPPQAPLLLALALQLRRDSVRLVSQTLRAEGERWAQSPMMSQAQPIEAPGSMLLYHPDATAVPAYRAAFSPDFQLTASDTTGPSSVVADPHMSIDQSVDASTASAIDNRTAFWTDSRALPSSASHGPETRAATAFDPGCDPPTAGHPSPPETLSLSPALASQPGAEPRTRAVRRSLACLEPVATQFGGFFFLLNVGLYLKLYGDFSTPLAPGIALNIWDFVALAGRELAGEDVTEDPIWQLLAELAGRDPGVPPGAGFEPPQEWTFPEEWTRALDLSPAPAPQVASVEDWLAWLMPYVRARLTRALGLADSKHVAAMLLHRPARAFLTLTHVDVVYPLQTHPVEIRLAGLDRDPGWIPAAGRYVQFHFE